MVAEEAAGFPDGFLFGAATAAYQIEGSPLADGAGPSGWHRFAHTPGLVANGDTGDVACDHYRRYREDFLLMMELGLDAYRFSIAWGRVLPEGTGRVNQQGLDFYRRLLDALGEAGIAAMATLFHWDLPAALDDRGGWLNRDSASWFAEYASVVFRALDDRVALWVTLNEPAVVTHCGYLYGIHAPGHRNLFEAPIAAHNLLRAHAEAVRAYRAEGRKPIGLVVSLEPKYPSTPEPADVAAAARDDAFTNRWFLDPVFLGRYPEELRDVFGEAWPEVSGGDLELLRTPVDFIGVNYYTRGVVRDDAAALPLRVARVRQEAAHTEMGWAAYPRGLFDILMAVRERYGDVPLYVTENGAAFADPPPSQDGVRDPRRVDYLSEHLRAVRQAMAGGVDVRGYFAWSLLDNFEWHLGYTKRFGLVHVDYATQRRTPKASARFYAEVIRSRGASLR